MAIIAAHGSHIADMPVYCIIIIIITFIISMNYDIIMFALHDDDEARVRADIFPLKKTDFRRYTLFLNHYI